MPPQLNGVARHLLHVQSLLLLLLLLLLRRRRRRLLRAGGMEGGREEGREEGGEGRTHRGTYGGGEGRSIPQSPPGMCLSCPAAVPFLLPLFFVVLIGKMPSSLGRCALKPLHGTEAHRSTRLLDRRTRKRMMAWAEFYTRLSRPRPRVVSCERGGVRPCCPTLM